MFKISSKMIVCSILKRVHKHRILQKLEEMPNQLLFIIYHSKGLVLPKQIPNHRHRIIGDMRASELACLNSNYISHPDRIGKHMRVIELQNTHALQNYKTCACYRTTKHMHTMQFYNMCDVEKKIQHYMQDIKCMVNS